ncbi:Octicosapeptide/Phox/Bem1p (PB1) domain-containing protein / tetratricopeptide repeat (TPR)-containing protein [Euphorbia peplus]|nr:Octicosapeptide/Phox/Bem1p (PB1) domain-containing protein / tetratricopeptide repeat (TPR)-containing protein [Euphorbia peplus]
MGKQSGKNKKREGPKSGDDYDKDTQIFNSMAQELKDEGNKMFQKRHYEAATLKYDKAIKLLPKNHIDVSYLRSNMAACYMQMGITEYPKAIRECNLALEVTPGYSKALIKRARCYEGLNRLDLALKDVKLVLKIEPNNAIALEVSERVIKALEEKGLRVNDNVIELPLEYVEPPSSSTVAKTLKEKTRKKKNKKVEEKKAAEEIEEKKVDSLDGDKETQDKVVVEEKISAPMEVPKKTVKLVFGEDIRWAKLPLNCNLEQLRQVISDRFPNSGEVLIKYKDQEGDLITITSDEELRWAETSAESQASIRLYIVKVNPQQDQFYEKPEKEIVKLEIGRNGNTAIENGGISKGGQCHIDEWVVEFAKVFKDHVGFESDVYLGLHELGIKLYSEAMEDTVTSEEAQDLFNTAAGKFQEMAALALFNWGNVHMSRARKRVYFTEDASRELVLEQIKTAYDWAQKEYTEAGQKYEAASKIKPDLYEVILAQGRQQFEQAKLTWYYTINNNVDLESWSFDEVMQLYNKAEDNMERGMQMWEESEVHRQTEISSLLKVRSKAENTMLDGIFKDTSTEEAAEQTKKMKSLINLLWGTILYERSLMEFKLELPVWHESLEVAVEKFEYAGASPSDIAIMIKNHVSNDSTMDGLGFKIDEIVEAWNEMHEAKRWHSEIPSFRLEPLLRRRGSKLCDALELA